MKNIVRPRLDESEDATTRLKACAAASIPDSGMDGAANVPGSSNRQDATL